MQISSFVVGRVGLPAAMDHPNPFERERADGGIVTFSALFLLVVKGPRPRRIRDRTFGVFMEGLAQELDVYKRQQ